MSKDAIVQARVEASLKSEVESIFKELGLTTTEAINLFYSQVKQEKRLPFQVKITNKKTAKVLKESEQGKNIIRCKDKEDFFKKLGF